MGEAAVSFTPYLPTSHQLHYTHTCTTWKEGPPQKKPQVVLETHRGQVMITFVLTKV